MTGETHAAAGIAAGCACAAIQRLEPKMAAACLCVCTLAALIPDVDEPQSVVGRRVPPVSRVVKHVFGHRGVLHSPEFWLIALLLALVWGGVSGDVCIWIALGAGTHLVLDSLTKRGIPVFVLWGKYVHLASMQERKTGETVIAWCCRAVALLSALYYAVQLLHFL